MNILENGQTKTRRVPRAVKLGLAAALAAACVLSIAAGLPAQIHHFISGGSLTINPGTDTAYYDRLHAADPVELDEDGRVWFTADGQRIDITDKVDETTPYIYERIDQSTGQKGYLVVGGSHDNLGWMEWFQMDGDWFWHAENCLNGSSAFSVGSAGTADGTIVVEVPDDIAPDVGDSGPAPSGDAGYATEGTFTADDSVPYAIDFRPWVEAAIAQLARMGVVECQPTVE